MPPSKDVFTDCYDGRPKKRVTLRTFCLVAMTTSAVFAIFFVGDYAQRVLARVNAKTKSGMSGGGAEFCLVRPGVRIIQSTLCDIPVPGRPQALVDSGLPVYDLRIAPQHLSQLQATAREVTAQGDSIGIPREYVPAQFMMEGRFIPIEAKLRGLTELHYNDRRPSLRLKFPENHLHEGRKQINLSNPLRQGPDDRPDH